MLERRVREGSFDWVYGAREIVLDRGGDAWVRPAFQALATHPDRRLAQLASAVLAKVGDASSLDTMLGALRTATDAWQRSSALHSILQLGRTTQVPVAERVIALASPNADEQTTLMLGLAALGEAASETRARDAITRAIRAALLHADGGVVAAAIRAALAHRLASLAPEVIGTLGHPRYYENAMSAARSAFSECAPDACVAARVAAVERGLADTTDEHAVELAARAMVGLDVGQHAALIARAFADGDYRVQNAAAFRLRATGTGDERDALLELVKRGPADVTAEALRGLERVGDRRGLAWLARRSTPPRQV